MLVEPDDVCLSLRRKPPAGFVPAVEHREVVRARELDDLSLDLGIALERAVAVEVVRRDVEDHADVQARPLHRLELEARKLEHDPVLGRELGQSVEDRLADVAADHHRPVAFGKDVAGERGGRGLAVGARDADDGAGAKLQEQVDLARDGDAPGARVIEELGVPRNAGAGVHGVDARQHAVVVAAESEVGAGGKARDGGFQLRARPPVGDDDTLAVTCEVVGDRHTAARGAHDQRGSHETRRATPKAASAPSSPAVQKDSAMRRSDQPSWWNV